MNTFLLKNEFFSIKFLFSLKFLVIIEETAFRKVYLSINHKSDDFKALIEAERGAE
jgi:hypothetical protein